MEKIKVKLKKYTYTLIREPAIFKKNHTIFKLIKRECNETNRDDMGYVQGIP